MATRATTAIAVAALVVSAGAAPLSARETRHLEPTESDLWITRGYSVHPCVPVVIEPNVTEVAPEHRDLVRGQLAEVVQIYNEVIGRDLFRMGADTTRDWRANDGHHVAKLLAHGDPDGGTNVARYASGRGRVVGVGTVDGGTHITDLGVEMDLELNPTSRLISVDTFLHELGHGLGFHHTIDGRSLMSYNFSRTNFYPDLHDPARFGPSLVKALRHLLPADCAYATIRQAHDWRKGGPAKAHIGSWMSPEFPTPAVLDEDVETVQDIGRSLFDGPGLDDGFGTRHEEPGRVVVCRDDLFADCLGGSALAGPGGAVVFVEGGPDGQLSDQVRERFGPEQVEVLILGGPNAVSPQVEQALRDHLTAVAGDPDDPESGASWTLERIAGATGTGRFGTAVAIADAMLERGASDELVLLARSDNPADAVAAGAIAARLGLPILLTQPHELRDTTAAWLAEHRPARMVVLGGDGAVQPGVAAAADVHVDRVERAWGRNRRATSVAIARHPWLWNRAEVTDSGAFWFVNGQHDDVWALALAAAPWAASAKAPVLLTHEDHLGMTQQGADGAPDPGWYFWNLDAPQPPDFSGDPAADDFPRTRLRTIGTPSGRYSHPFLANTAVLTATARSTYANDGG